MPEVDESARKWLGRIELAKAFQAELGNQNGRWGKFTKALAGDFGNADVEEAIDVNMVHSTTALNLAPLHTSDVYLTVRAKQPTVEVEGKQLDNVMHARFTEVELNHWNTELRIREKVIRPCVHDAETTNLAYCYVGYVDKDNEGWINGLDDKGDPRVGKRVEWNPLVKVDQPFAVRLAPSQVLVPPLRVEFEENPYIITGWTAPKHVVEARFPDANLTNVEPTIDPFDEIKDTSPRLKQYLDSGDQMLFQIWQVWDREEMMLRTYIEDHEQTIEEGEWPWKPEGYPVVAMRFLDVPEEYHGSPPIQMYWAQQRELNWARTASKKRNNQIKQVIFVTKEIADAVGERYKNAEDGELISVPLDDTDAKLSDHMIPVKLLEAPNEAYADGSVQINDIMFITGHGPQQRAAGDPDINTATESANVDKWSLIRATDRGSRTKSFILDIHRRIWSVLRQHPDKKRERMITGDIGARALTLRYTLKQIHGEFAFNLDLGSLLGDNPVQRQRLALANYNLLRADPRVDEDRLILDLLDSQGKTDPVTYLNDRDPDRELQQMLQRLPVEAILRDDHETHMRVHEAQMLQLEQELEQLPDDQLDGDVGFAGRMVLALVQAHQNQHAFFVQQITGQAPDQPGNPQDENQLRDDLSTAPDGSETPAELEGQPRNSPTPAPIGGISRQVQ